MINCRIGQNVLSRRIQVSTLSLPYTTTLSNLFRFADLDTLSPCILKQVTGEVPSTPLPQATEQAKNLCINILHLYRKFCASASAPGQLILPEALKLLPLYTLGISHVASKFVRIDCTPCIYLSGL
ncbi:protein transport protein Sec24-like CEF [Olea europaea var. sylvestris]|uniref:protein transport protein Sec24-like CEF n=1 Tax=Olea europaea var. sylvestris TaxID=158386 RepID=UPI000C1D15A3|nr:protein transport protein Sec24-like CEF [Olea europaea var. sylvestris]